MALVVDPTRKKGREGERQRDRESERDAGELSGLLRHFAGDRGRAEGTFLGSCGFPPQVQVSTEFLVSNAPFRRLIFLLTLYFWQPSTLLPG